MLPTFEPLHSAIGGLLTRTGGELNAPRIYLTHMDYGCGLTSATMTIAALIEREHSGKGQYIEVPQTGAGLLAMSDAHGYEGRISETFPLDYDQRGHAPTNALYRTADGWIVIACYSAMEWEGVRRGLGIASAQWPGYERARQEKVGDSETVHIYRGGDGQAQPPPTPNAACKPRASRARCRSGSPPSR